ncbi:cobalt transporter CbiM [Enterococcus hirae]|uniref:cobalt transporter CbiM n=1 Tax=Enterococcus TaxID=1350 RepID=UPI0015F27868|nr:cobalt transporter CbiM [Enterococcus hirae]MBA5252610.1 cobalt transporter CbiM [Enterococcus hirae]MBS6193041.1 cobalt transporter CbiM [Enterococcus hirae]MDU1571301.1 cobalt transporter CbiM [Enterococcus hirae]MDU4894802.1 cobalt transporter CbiM [Enterococcus hirae]
MHLPDNYLSPQTCGFMFALSTPIVVTSVNKIKLELKNNSLMAPMLGISSSLSFLIMMFNIPIPGGTTAHAVGGTLLAILVGPYAACISLSVSLILQAFLFGDGGILSLGANIFNIACIMPFSGYYIYNIFRKKQHRELGTIIGSYVGINLSALLVSLELGIQPIIFHDSSGVPLYNPYSIEITVPAMMIAHLFIAGVIESFFTYTIYKFIYRVSPDSIYYDKKDKVNIRYNLKYLYRIIFMLVIISPIGLISKDTAFGEWSGKELLNRLINENIMSSLPMGIKNGLSYNSIFTDYVIPGVSDSISYILSALTAVLLFIIGSKVLGAIYGKSKNSNLPS